MSVQQEKKLEEVQNMKKENHALKQELKHYKDTIEKLQEKERLLKNRLSEQVQKNLKISSKFEDLSLGSKRPSQLISQYGNLYTEARLDAFDALDDVPEIADFDDLKGKLLFSVIVLAFRSVNNMSGKLQEKLRYLLCISEEDDNQTSDNAAREVEDAIRLYLMKTIDSYDLSANIEEVSGQVYATLYDYPSLKACSGLKQYIADCVRVSWCLAVQKPNFVIKYDSPLFDENIHTRFHASNAESNVVKMVLWPSLFEGETGVCVHKGVVLT